jgi:hypothetical protein
MGSARYHHQDVHRLPTDDGVRVGPVEGGMHVMRVPRRATKARELLGLDGGGDVHTGFLGAKTQ